MLKLSKGDDLVLAKADGTAANAVTAGVGWDAATESNSVDLDIAATVFKGKDVVTTLYYGSTKNGDGKLAIPGATHSGDDLTGDASDDGPDEEIQFDLSKIEGDRVELLVNLYNAGSKGQTLGIAKNAFAVIGGDVEDARFDITDELIGHTMHVGTLTKADDGWHFKPVGAMLGDVDLNGANAAVA